MRTWNRWLIILALSINIKALAQTTPVTVTVKSAIDMALTNNYSLKADSLNMAAAGYQANALKSSLLPHLSYNSKAEYNPAIASTMLPGQYVGQPSKEYVPVQFGTRYSMGSGLEASYNLFRKDLRYPSTLLPGRAMPSLRMAPWKEGRMFGNRWGGWR